MLCSVTHHGIDGMISDPDINSSTSCFKFVISDDFIEYIEKTYKNDQTKLHVFQNWISLRFQQKNRLRYIAKDDTLKYFKSPKNEEIFVSCALFSGHFLFGNTDLETEHYHSHGIGIHDIKKSADFHGVGDNPIYEERLEKNGTRTPISLMKYFVGEQDIIFIDNYINFKSLSFIEYIIDALDKKSNITIITKNDSLNKLSRANILSYLSKNSQHHNLKVLTFQNNKEFHDRHIVIGNRLFIDASAGLDAFSFYGDWNNRESKFSVYDVYDNSIDRSFIVLDEHGIPRTISIKMPT